MSDAATRILQQLQAQNDLRMEAANDIAQAVSARVNAENALVEAQAKEKSAFTNALKKGWTQQELNKISPTRTARKRTTKSQQASEQPEAHDSTN